MLHVPAITAILWTIFRAAPKLIAIAYAIILVLSSASVAVRDNNPSIFFTKGIGAVASGADDELYKNIEDMKVKVKENTAGILEMINIIGAILLIYYMLKIIHWVLAKSFNPEMVSSVMLWFWAFLILGMFQTMFYSITQGQVIIGYRGMVNFILNLDTFFYPIYAPVMTLGQASARSPIF